MQQRVEVGRDLRAVLRFVGGIAPPATGTVVDTDTGVAGHGRGDPSHVRRHLACAGLEHHRRCAGASAVQVQFVSADVDQLTGHLMRCGICRCTHGGVTAADRGRGQYHHHRVEKPASGAATKRSVCTDEHPDHQRQQGRGPHPAEHPVHRRAERHQDKTTCPHEHCRSPGPPLGLIREPHGKHRQHRPAQREAAQHCAGHLAFPSRDERGGDEQ